MVNPRDPIRNLSICEHGGTGRNDIIDFSVNTNPYGPPNSVFDAVREAMDSLNTYPDPESSELRVKIAEKCGCETRQVLVGAGVSELIRLVAMSFVKERALMLKHTYGEYEIATKLMGSNVKRIDMPNLKIRLDLVLREIKKDDVIFLCNPNNPTGQYLRKREIKQIMEKAEMVDALLVIDEAYVDFVSDAFSSHELISPNLIILRSLTKSFAIPGVRIGYAISTSENIRVLRKVKVPWNVSVFAQKMGEMTIGEEDFLKETRDKIENNKRWIEERLNVYSDVNFYVLNVRDAKKVKRDLLRCNILVRDCTSFGLPSHIRFSVRTQRDNEKLLKTLRSVLRHRHP